MTTSRVFRLSSLLVAAALITVPLAAKPLYAAEGDADAKKAEQQKKAAAAKEAKDKKPVAAPTTSQYPGDNRVPGMGY
jgi:hypothetical protein